MLVAGGSGSSSGSNLASAEIYNPATNSWSAAGSLGTARYDHTATLLDNGRVLVAAGSSGTGITNAEVYNPSEQQLERHRLARHGTQHSHRDPAR